MEIEQTKMKEQIILEDNKNCFTSLEKNNVEKKLRYIGAVDISLFKKNHGKHVECLIICEYLIMSILYEDYDYDTCITQP